jgi:hypothetical protein
MKTLYKLTLILISLILILVVLKNELPDTLQSILGAIAGTSLGFAFYYILIDMKSRNKIEQLKRIERIKQAILKAYPEATDLSYERNGITHGIYYRLPKAKLRSFRPMSEKVLNNDNLTLYLMLLIIFGILIRIISVIHNMPILGYVGGIASLVAVIALSITIFNNIKTSDIA